ncbi:MAG: pilus biogenesis protein [Nitrospirales bacterium]|nr:MAG: pilus biogenesis protein [Nitrospirales bacterium]
MNQILLDTGPLVAFLNRRDHFHDWTKTVWEQAEPPFLSCEAVLAEACFLLRRSHNGAHSVLEMVKRGVITTSFRLENEVATVDKLLVHYADVPMSLADACLVRMAELSPKSSVLTIDDDFLIYRKNRRQKIPLVMPSH